MQLEIARWAVRDSNIYYNILIYKNIIGVTTCLTNEKTNGRLKYNGFSVDIIVNYSPSIASDNLLIMSKL